MLKDPVLFLSRAVTIGFYSLVIMLFFREPPMGSQGAILAAVGTAGTLIGTIVGFYFGSSQGSRDKDKAAQAKNGEPTVP